MRRAVGEVCKKLWRGEGFSESWKEGIIVPIAKKSGAKRVEEHREVTLLLTAYKIYATVLAEKLEKGMLPEGQAGLRKGRGVIDNIYVLNYLVEREVARGRKMTLH